MIFNNINDKKDYLKKNCLDYSNKRVIILFCYSIFFCVSLYSQQEECPSRFPQIIADTGLCHEHICFFVNGKMAQTKGYYIIDMGEETRDTIWFNQNGAMVFYYVQQYKKMLLLPPETKIKVCYYVYNHKYYLVHNVLDFVTGDVDFIIEDVPLSYVFSYGDNKNYSLCMITTSVPFPKYYKCSFFKLFEDCLLSRYSTDNKRINKKLDYREQFFYFRDRGLLGHLWIE